MVKALENHPADSRIKISEDGVVQTLSSRMGTGGNNTPMVLSDVAATRSAKDGPGAVHSQMLSNPEENFVIEDVAAVDCRNGTENPDINGTLQAKEQGQNVNSNNVCRVGYVVRRLTPLECTRLQGFPDGWVDIGEWTNSKGKKHKDSDSPKYKALGNSIALPFWEWLTERITMMYDRPLTMGSLFDGISGFPLAFYKQGVKPVWTSEIEDFPISVCKKHFGDEDAGIEGDIESYFTKGDQK